MSAKRFTNHDDTILDTDGEQLISTNEIVDKMNELYDENKQLKFQLQNTSDQRDEFFRGARENANRVGKLEEENKQLKHKLDDWHQRTFKAHEYFNILEKVIDEVCDDDVSNQIWKEYEKREKLIE